MEETKGYSQWKTVLTMVCVDFAFAFMNLLLKKVLDEGMNHLVLMTYRQIVATLFIAPIAYVWERNKRPKMTWGIILYLFFSAMLGVTLTQYFFFLGIQYTSATFSCAFINMVPVFTYIMALPFGLEVLKMGTRAGKAKFLGSVVCICGVLVLTLYKGMKLTDPLQRTPASIHIMSSDIESNQDNKERRWTIGTLALLGGSLCWSSWFLIQSKVGKRYSCVYSSTAIVTIFSTIQASVLCLATQRNISAWIIKGKVEIFTVLYGGLVSSGICFLAMSWCVEQRGPLFTAAFTPLVQMIVAVVDFSLLSRPLHLGSILGSLLVIMGLYFLLWGKSKEAKESASKEIQV